MKHVFLFSSHWIVLFSGKQYSGQPVYRTSVQLGPDQLRKHSNAVCGFQPAPASGDQFHSFANNQHANGIAFGTNNDHCQLDFACYPLKYPTVPTSVAQYPICNQSQRYSTSPSQKDNLPPHSIESSPFYQLQRSTIATTNIAKDRASDPRRVVFGKSLDQGCYRPNQNAKSAHRAGSQFFGLPACITKETPCRSPPPYELHSSCQFTGNFKQVDLDLLTPTHSAYPFDWHYESH